ncbi:MAG TPA: hypothetical protein VJ694_05340, partial [Patescibacteria group bacterium]|nr:hypothetical protein [Patescibacteria group bacterium]
MTTKDTASANGNGSTPDADTLHGIDTDTLREMAAAEKATGTAGTDTGTEPMPAVPEPAAVQQTTISPPPREPGGLDTAEPDAGDRETIPEHVPGTTNPRTTRKILYVAGAIALLAGLLVFGRLLSGSSTADAEQAQAPIVQTPVSQPVAQAAATVVPKDTDATECATMGTSTDTFRPGWCKDRAPGAYLLADDTMAY